MQLRTLTLAGAAAAIACSLASGQALAWGHTGHLMISELAIENLPRDVPEFLRDHDAKYEVTQLGPEPDVLKSEGDAATPNADVFDFEHSPGHYVDLDDVGLVLGYPTLPLSSLMAQGQSRRDYDTLLRAASSNKDTQYFAGYLPFQMTDGWQQVRKDFAYYRAYKAALQNERTMWTDRAAFKKQLQLREQLLLRDIGYWSHFVADASQPMHVSIHFNGWGAYPNPNNYTNKPIHAPFEGSFVKNYISIGEVASHVGSYVPCGCAGIEPRVRSYLAATLATVDTTYALEKAINNAYATNDAGEHEFIVSRLAAGATELRDEIVDAWRSSDTIYVGFPLIKVSDIESGAVVLTQNLLASD
jgi:hypothetical protein